jgi:hypothetical protein
VDGNEEDRSGTVSVFNGPEPEVRIHADEDEEIAADASDLDEIFETERQLFYVACARDRLLVSGVEPASDFFADLDL